jgi:hypothetical protein
MTVMPGLLDRRISIYERQDAGADGFQRPVYVKTLERWGRIDDTADSQTVPLAPQAHMESRTTAMATLADYVEVPKFGLLRENDGPLYYVRGTFVQRALRCQKVTLEAIDPTQAASFAVFEDVEVLDGTHLITGA